MDELQYLEKYLKYKQKYYELEHGGAKLQELGTNLRVSGIKFSTKLKNFSTRNINLIQEDFKLPEISYPTVDKINKSELKKLDQFLVYILAYTKYAISAIVALENMLFSRNDLSGNSQLKLNKSDLKLIGIADERTEQKLSQELQPSPNPTNNELDKFTFNETTKKEQENLTPRSPETIKKEQEENLTAVGGFLNKGTPKTPVAVTADSQMNTFKSILMRAKKLTYFVNKSMDTARELLKEGYSSNNEIVKKDPIRYMYTLIISIKQSGTILSKVSDEDRKIFTDITGDEIEFSEKDLSTLKKNIIDFNNQISLNENNAKKDLSIDILKLCKVIKFNGEGKTLGSLKTFVENTKKDIDTSYNEINHKFQDYYDNPLNQEEVKKDIGKLRDSIQFIIDNISNVKKISFDKSCFTTGCPIIGFKDFNFDSKLMVKKSPSVFNKLKDILGIRKADISIVDLQQFLNTATEQQIEETVSAVVNIINDELDGTPNSTLMPENEQTKTSTEILAQEKIKNWIIKKKFETKLQTELAKANGDLGLLIKDKTIPYAERRDILQKLKDELNKSK